VPLAEEVDPIEKAARKRAAAPRKKAAPKVTVVDAPIQAADMATTPAPWVAPEPGGLLCPTSHPVKGKLSSKLFHLPGMFAYNRTKPDRCYRDAEAAEADGLQRAKK
jgi:micrococcal nuclease